MIGVADLKCLSADNGAARIERRSEATTNQRTAPIAPGHHLVQYFPRFAEQESTEERRVGNECVGTANEMRISDWSSDVCSSDLAEIDREQRFKLARRCR